MSSTRLIFNSLKLTAIAGVNFGAVAWGYQQYQRNQEIVSQLPEEKRGAIVGNSGDALAVMNERAQRKC